MKYTLEKNQKTNLNVQISIDNPISEKSPKKLTLFTLILLGNVAWISPSHGMLNEEDTTKFNNVISIKKEFDIAQPEKKIAAAQALANAVESIFSQLKECMDIRNICQTDLTKSKETNQNFIEQQTILTTRVQVLDITLEKCEKNLQKYKQQNATHTAERNEWVKEREFLQAQNHNITDQLNKTAVDLAVCGKRNDGFDGIRDLEASNKLIKCYEEKNNISDRKNELNTEFEKYKSQYHKLENELNWYNNAANLLQEKAYVLGSSALKGGVYAIFPKLLNDLNCPRGAGAAKVIVPAVGTALSVGYTAYTAYTEGDYTPAITMVGSAAIGGLSNLFSNYLLPENENGSAILGSIAAVTTSTFIQGGVTLETISNIGNSLIAMGGGTLGSVGMVKGYDFLKSYFSYGTANGNNPGDDSDGDSDDAPEDNNNSEKSNGLTPSIKQLPAPLKSETIEDLPESFSSSILSLKPLVKQLKGMDLDSKLHSSESTQEDVEAIKNISVLLCNTVQRGKDVEPAEEPQLTLKDALEHMKEIMSAPMSVAPFVEEEIGIRKLELINQFKRHYNNIISSFK